MTCVDVGDVWVWWVPWCVCHIGGVGEGVWWVVGVWGMIVVVVVYVFLVFACCGWAWQGGVDVV